MHTLEKNNTNPLYILCDALNNIHWWDFCSSIFNAKSFFWLYANLSKIILHYGWAQPLVPSNSNIVYNNLKIEQWYAPPPSSKLVDLPVTWPHDPCRCSPSGRRWTTWWVFCLDRFNAQNYSNWMQFIQSTLHCGWMQPLVLSHCNILHNILKMD